MQVSKTMLRSNFGSGGDSRKQTTHPPTRPSLYTKLSLSIFSGFNLCSSLPSIATNDRKQFQCLNIECFHMTSRRPYWCPKTMKRWPCWCPKPVLWELNSFLVQTLSFVPINLHRYWPREWKHSVVLINKTWPLFLEFNWCKNTF